MGKKAAGISLCLGFFTFACISLAAQSGQIRLAQRSPIVRSADAPSAGLTKIYSNLGPKNDLYDSGLGWAITGPQNSLWGKGYVAMPFTPASDSVVKEVLIALSQAGSGEKGAVGIFTDANSVPGELLKAWGVANFPQSGTCCKLVALKDTNGVALTAGTQYWIVAGSDKGSPNANYEWAFVWNDASGPLAFLNGNTNDQWLAYNDNLAAFAVYGTLQ